MNPDDDQPLLRQVAEGLSAGTLAPYLGPGMLSLCEGDRPPADPLALAAWLSARSPVPGKIRHRFTAVAQFIENFKHRKTLVRLMHEAYAAVPAPSPLHRWLAALPTPLVVDAWYDDTFRQALAAGRRAWYELQGLSQSEHFGTWFGAFDAAGGPCVEPPVLAMLLYRPWGGRSPADNYLVSDSDFVEVLTEIDIQTPIPPIVQALRARLGFVFLGCRFDDQLPRAFARQILKRSRGPHFAVLPDTPTRMEAKFLAELGITRIAMPLADVAQRFTETQAAPV
ncbi:MAG TPA: SIR2 family protein [Burkholderiaceae bacterium]|mgnify:CR=1 FL=1|nr:SIR2 family protein [Burkholderiaceae bacterium]